MSELTKRIGFIGAGQMATALAQGFLQRAGVAPEYLAASEAFESARESFSQKTGVQTMESNVQLVTTSEVVILAVKPQVIQDVLEEIRPCVTPNHLIISIAAGVTLGRLEDALGANLRLVRVMPNTPCLIGEGASAFCFSDAVSQEDLDIVARLLKSVGRCFMVDESKMDAVTGLSGSGPAYIYLVIEALADAGVMAGLPRDVAQTLAAQTVRGAAGMVLETKEHPGLLKDKVTSPGGTTIAGMKELESHGVRAAMYDAVLAATRRSKELGAK
ncbi:MAG: pyrroline-5-carboxylate reductase [Planctomycetia bacterium]|nr:pyrroline-5-carboxylate reductase [Planctomycetia bacterium]